MRNMILMLVFVGTAWADVEIVEQPNSISAQLDGKVLWTYNHDVEEGKPYFHPLSSTDGTMFTDLRPEDHPWHRGLWFSWKHINGVNYWEEDRQTGKSKGETRIRKIVRTVTEEKTVHLQLEVDYAPAGTDDTVLKEQRRLIITAPNADGMYRIDWSSTFTAVDEDVKFDRTPIPGEPNGKSYGGYAGWSVRMNREMKGGRFLKSQGNEIAHRASAKYTMFESPTGGGLLFLDHSDNLNSPSKWYIAPEMPYFSPAVIHDAPHTMKAGESLRLQYRLIVSPQTMSSTDAEAYLKDWQKKRVVILTGANNHAWQKTTPVLETLLKDSGSFEVDVVTDPEKLTPDFLSQYDVLVSNWNGFGKNKPAPWSEGLKQSYVDFVRKGGGHVVVHAGSSSFYDWDEYHAICLATWKLEQTGHGKQHEFDVRPTANNHFITEVLSTTKTFDELWYKPGVHQDAKVIAEAHSKTTGNWEPSALVGQFGQGRCFCLLLGHGVKQMNQSAFKTLFQRGVTWACGDQ